MALLLLFTVGIVGLAYTLIVSLVYVPQVSFWKYWGDLMYAVNVGIDKIGNVMLAEFLNRYAIRRKGYDFGDVNHTISHVIAKNRENLRPLGLFIANTLEKIDPGHLDDSL